MNLYKNTKNLKISFPLKRDIITQKTARLLHRSERIKEYLRESQDIPTRFNVANSSTEHTIEIIRHDPTVPTSPIKSIAINVPMEIGQEKSPFCRINPAIRTWALESSENLATILIFVQASIGVNWIELNKNFWRLMQHIREHNGFPRTSLKEIAISGYSETIFNFIFLLANEIITKKKSEDNITSEMKDQIRKIIGEAVVSFKDKNNSEDSSDEDTGNVNYKKNLTTKTILPIALKLIDYLKNNLPNEFNEIYRIIYDEKDGSGNYQYIIHPSDYQTTFSFLIRGEKLAHIDRIWRNRERLYREVSPLLRAFKYGESTNETMFEIFKKIVSIPGFAAAKAGFSVQLLTGRIGCIDSNNIMVYESHMQLSDIDITEILKLSIDYKRLTKGELFREFDLPAKPGPAAAKSKKFQNELLEYILFVEGILNPDSLKILKNIKNNFDFDAWRQQRENIDNLNASKKLWDDWVYLISIKQGLGKKIPIQLRVVVDNKGNETLLPGFINIPESRFENKLNKDEIQKLVDEWANLTINREEIIKFFTAENNLTTKNLSDKQKKAELSIQKKSLIFLLKSLAKQHRFDELRVDENFINANLNINNKDINGKLVKDLLFTFSHEDVNKWSKDYSKMLVEQNNYNLLIKERQELHKEIDQDKETLQNKKLKKAEKNELQSKLDKNIKKLEKLNEKIASVYMSLESLKDKVLDQVRILGYGGPSTPKSLKQFMDILNMQDLEQPKGKFTSPGGLAVSREHYLMPVVSIELVPTVSEIMLYLNKRTDINEEIKKQIVYDMKNNFAYYKLLEMIADEIEKINERDPSILRNLKRFRSQSFFNIINPNDLINRFEKEKQLAFGEKTAEEDKELKNLDVIVDMTLKLIEKKYLEALKTLGNISVVNVPEFQPHIEIPSAMKKSYESDDEIKPIGGGLFENNKNLLKSIIRDLLK